MDSAWDTAHEYGHFYVTYTQGLWDNMTPMQYGGILIAIAVGGYILMKNGAKGP